MELSFDIGWFSAFLLAMVRATAWLFVAPPFASTGVPVRVRLGLAVGLALFVAPRFDGGNLADAASFIPAVLHEAAIGLAMGFGVYLLISAVQTAGGLIDFSAAFSAASAYDPLANTSSTPFARLYHMLALTVLFASGGHAIIVRGFLTSFGAGRDGATATFEVEQAARILAHDLSAAFAAALQLAVPLMAALFVAEVAMGLVAKAVPQMNIISLSFGAKTAAALVLGGLAIKVLPTVLYPLVTLAADTMVALGR